MKECPACHAFNHDEANFCAVCGVKFAPSEDARDASPAAENPSSEQTKYGQEAMPMPAYDKENMQTDFSVPVIQNDSPMTPATLKELYAPIRNAGFILLACGAVLLLLQILMMIPAPENSDTLLLICAIMIFSCGAVYIGMYYGSLTKNKLFTNTAHALYVCNEKGLIQYMYDKDQKTGEQFIGYEQITKVTARKNFLLLRFGPVAWIIDRRAFTQGTESDFLNLLRSRGVNVKVK